MMILGFAIFGALVMFSCSQGTNKKAATVESKSEMMDLSGFKTDLSKSKVLWSGTSLGVYTHTGTVDFVKADIDVKNNAVTGGSFTVDLSTMKATDENFNAEAGYTKDKLIGHLSSPDFFDVQNFPTASFEIKSVEGSTAKGILTIRGISNEETVTDIEVKQENGKAKITGNLVFDRKKYDVAWDYPTKDRLLKKEIELKITLWGM